MTDNVLKKITDYKYRDTETVEEVNDALQIILYHWSPKKVYDHFLTYRASRTAARNAVHGIDAEVGGVIDGSNHEAIRENANKNAKLNSTKRDLSAGSYSRGYARRNMLPPHIMKAHDDGLIHFHDLDYALIDTMNNCFARDTKFITSHGVKSFNDFNDGDIVEVPTHTGAWKKGVVRNYGKQQLYKYMISPINRKGYGVKVRATSSHRWFNENGREQIGLSVGDKLLTKNYIIDEFDLNTATPDLKKYWCYGFVIGDGCTTPLHPKTDKGASFRTVARLCGKKNEYAKYFIECGYTTHMIRESNDVTAYLANEFNKNEFLDNETWKTLSKPQLQALFNGLLCADGAKGKKERYYHGITSSNPKVVQLIKDIADVAGYFITNITVTTNDTNYGPKTNPLYWFQLQTYKPTIYTKQNGMIVSKPKTLKVCEMAKDEIEDVWCLEVEDDHSFVLQGGIITGNCGLINLYDMLWNGTVINGKMIERPHSIQTAATVASQIILQVSNNQYGGCTINLAHLAPWVNITRQKWLTKYTQDFMKIGARFDSDICQINAIMQLANERTWEDIMSAMQTIQYQLNTFSSLNGQSPFVSIFMWIDDNASEQEKEDTALLIKATLIQRRRGIKNEKGQWSTPAFPKLLFCMDENNMWPSSPYYELKKMAIDSTIYRMNPDYMSAKMLRKYYEGNVFGCMGCRSILSPWKNENGEYQFWGRWNRGVISLNIPDAALTAKKESRDFFEVLDERLELCREALKIRDSWVRRADVDNSPIHWKYGAYARLKDGETVEEMCDNGYSTISLGYVGLSDAVYVLTGEQINGDNGYKMAEEIMQYLYDWTVEHKKEHGLVGLGLYGTPAESLIGKFARTIRKRFGDVEGVACPDKNWLTNSYHISPLQPINAFDKIKFESKLQALSLGGAISYVELPSMKNNPEAVEALLNAAYDQLVYFELNSRDSDQCLTCGYEGPITPDENGNWKCPVCGEVHSDKLLINRRICGYVGSYTPNESKLQEIQKRVLHL